MIILAISGALVLHVIVAMILRRWILADVRRNLAAWQEDIRRCGC